MNLKVFNTLPHTTSYGFINCFRWHTAFVYGEILYLLKNSVSKRKMNVWEHPRKPLWFYYLDLLRSHFFIFLLLINFMPINLWKYGLKLFLDALPSLWGIGRWSSRCLTMGLQPLCPLAVWTPGSLVHKVSMISLESINLQLCFNFPKWLQNHIGFQKIHVSILCIVNER